MTYRQRLHSPAVIRIVSILLIGLFVGPGHVTRVAAQDYQRISGSGSSWAKNAIEDMRVNVLQFGITVDYSGTGSSAGRADFLRGQVDFAASDIPFQFDPDDGSNPENPVPGSYAYIPVTAGGTAFMYNLKIGGQPVTNLRLSGENVAKIFTGVITMWNDPAIAADNPGLVMPARTIVPIVRSDGSGSTAQFTRWMIDRHRAIWNDFCERSGRAPKCGVTSNYPSIQGVLGSVGDDGVAGTVAGPQNEGAIGYVNYSYAIGLDAPVAKVLNAAGYYTEPTPRNVAVSLLQAKINRDESNPAVYLTQQLEGVYSDTDPRNYQLSSYSYFILPTTVIGTFNEDKGYTLSVFTNYAMCEAQQNSEALGYSPMPVSLVRDSLEQIRKIPGAIVEDIDISQCENPTFDKQNPDDPNKMASLAPMPKECDRQGLLQCPDGTGGKSDIPTAVSTPQTSGGVITGGGTDTGNTDGGTGAVDGGIIGETGAVDNGTTGGIDAASESGGVATGSVGSTSGASAGTRGTTGNAVSPGAAANTSSGSSGSSGGVGGTDSSSGGQPVVTGADGSALSCDPDTGECAAAASGNAADQSTGEIATQTNAVVGAVTPTNLDGGPGFGQAVLIVLVILLTLALVLGPALAWRYFSNGAVA